MKINYLYFAFIALLITICSLIHFWGINWGTPSWERSFQVFKSDSQITELAPKMIELRSKLYSKAISFSNRKTKFTKEDFDNYFTPHNLKPFDTLSNDIKLDFMRGYLLGLVLSDEQQVLNAMANIHPEKLDFDPDTNYTHGAFYYYSLGAFLMIGKYLQFLHITNDPNLYFLHPNYIENVYLLARSFSVIFSIFCAILLFFIGNNIFNKKIGVLSSLFFSLSPLILTYSHQVKPHTFGMFLMLLSFYLCSRAIITSERTKYVLVSVILGLSSAILLSNIVFVLMIPLCEFYTRKNSTKYFRWGTTILPIFLVFIVYVILTPYSVLSFQRFFNSAIAHNYVVYGYGKFGIRGAILFLYGVFNFGHFWVLIPAIVLGAIYLYKQKKPENSFLLTISLVFTVFAGFFMKHPGVFTLTMPFLCIFAAAGIFALTNSTLFNKIIGYSYGLLIVCSLILSTCFYEQLFVQKGNLTFAGQWINENIPKKSSIGIPTGWALPGHFPAIEFLSYKLINIPLDESVINQNSKKFPEYLVVTHPFMQISTFEKIILNYKPIKMFEAPKKLLGIPFSNDFIPTENMDVLILKKNDKTS
ncbi:MAG: glycosyltransferase family 39 protein [Elusimicrobia bacterium]|nr:glycosyltransferase family 39 protein [Elusimicrobiota bacterium]